MPTILNATTTSGITISPDNSGVLELRSNGVQGASGTVVQATSQATTSGTIKEFTGIPSWVKRIYVMFDTVSTNGTSNILVQLGTSSGYETTGYFGATSVNTAGVATTNFTTGFLLTQQTTAASSKHGIIVISNCLNNTWIASINTGESGIAWTHQGAGSKSLGGVLTQLRITTVNGTDVFDLGNVNIQYQG
jgi:hypothetical protein